MYVGNNHFELTFSVLICLRKKLENIASTQLMAYIKKGRGSGISAIRGADTADTCEMKFRMPKDEDWNCVGNRVLFVTYMMLSSIELPTRQRMMKTGMRERWLNRKRYITAPVAAVKRDTITERVSPKRFRTKPEIR
jgi:hypothetical protein